MGRLADPTSIFAAPYIWRGEAIHTQGKGTAMYSVGMNQLAPSRLPGPGPLQLCQRFLLQLQMILLTQ